MGDEAHLRTTETGAFAPPLVRGCERKLHCGMTRDEGAELATRVPTRAEDANRDSMHAECILLQDSLVNLACCLPGSCSNPRATAAARAGSVLSSRHPAEDEWSGQA